MILQTIGYILEFPEIDEDVLEKILDPPIEEPMMVNINNITLITPGDEDSTIIYTTDSLTLFCTEPYEVIENKIINSGNHTFIFKAGLN